MRKLLLVLAVVALAATVAVGHPKIGLILATGGLGDRSFNDMGYWGAEMAAEEIAEQYGVSVDDVLDYVEPREIADYEGYYREFARTGEYDIIVCIGFDHAEPLEFTAPDYPDQKFVIVDDVADADNVASVLFNDQEAAFLCGVVAGMISDTGKAGVLGGMDIPLIRRFVDGFTQGMQWVDADAEVMSRFVGAWNDPTLGMELSREMYRAGADIIYGAAGGSHLGTFVAAEDSADRWAIGTDVDQAWSVPEHSDVIIASGLKRVDLAVYEEIMKVIDGTWEPGVIQYGLATETRTGHGIAFGPWDVSEYIQASYSTASLPNDVVRDVLLKLDEAVQGILDGTIEIEVE